jgi:transcriptional regulator with XRE-family HTH domain
MIDDCREGIMSVNTKDMETSFEKTMEEKGDLLQKRDEFEKRLLKIKKDLDIQTATFESIETKLDKDNLVPGEEADLQKKYVYLASSIEELKKEYDYYKSLLNKVTEQLQSKKHFHKDIFLQNLRVLLKESDVKIGQIEKESGIQTGYVSRLEKPGNTTDPSAEFITTASHLLNVPIDMLVNTSIGEMSPGEKKMLSFFQSLIEDTRRGDLAWNKEPELFFEKEKFTVLDCETGETDHPLFRCEQYYNQEQERMITHFTYLTAFYPDEEVDVIGNSYNAPLQGTDASIYLMKCGDWEELSPDYLSEFFEVYFVEKSGVVNPVCCTAQSTQPIAEIVKALYLEAEIAGKQSRLTPEAANIISKYYRYKKEGLPTKEADR